MNTPNFSATSDRRKIAIAATIPLEFAPDTGFRHIRFRARDHMYLGELARTDSDDFGFGRILPSLTQTQTRREFDFYER